MVKKAYGQETLSEENLRFDLFSSNIREFAAGEISVQGNRKRKAPLANLLVEVHQGANSTVGHLATSAAKSKVYGTGFSDMYKQTEDLWCKVGGSLV